MFCENCGKEINENSKFCVYCGSRCGETITNVNNVTQEEVQNDLDYNDIEKLNTLTGTINIVAAAILILIGFADIDYDWGAISLGSGIGILVAGILQAMKKSYKTIGIIQIIFGSVTMLISFGSDLEYDWSGIGLLIGIALLVIGILNLLNKSWKAISIVTIVFGGCSILFAFSCIEYDWGIIGLAVGASFLVDGILNLVIRREQNE